VGKKTYQILNKNLEKVSKHGDYGRMSFDASLIELCTTLSNTGRESTLIHELIHAIDFAKDIGLTENQVLKLESGLMNLFRTNGWKIQF